MDIQTRKLEFIKEFLKIENDELIDQLESLLNKKKNLNPLTKEGLNNRVEESEEDFKYGRFRSSDEILEKYLNTKTSR